MWSNLDIFYENLFSSTFNIHARNPAAASLYGVWTLLTNNILVDFDCRQITDIVSDNLFSVNVECSLFILETLQIHVLER